VTVFLFPDNTVLCNFACADRLDLLEAVLNGRGRWTSAVAYEASQSANQLGQLRGLHAGGWLGVPIEIVEEQHVSQIQRIRRLVFGGADDQPLKHLGEAETCFVLKEWDDYVGSWWISDDRDALRYARFQGITTRETIDLIAEAIANGDIDGQSAFNLMKEMEDQGRHLRTPNSPADLMRR
jgi:predicted nucleic acid-binding protein